MSHNSVTACIPSVRGRDALPTLFTVCSQDFPIERVILYDTGSEKVFAHAGGLESYFAYLFGVEVHQAKVLPVLPNPARNYLIEQVDTELTLFVDDDVWLAPNCLTELHRVMLRDAWVNIVGGTKLDVLPQRNPWGDKSWGRMKAKRERDIRTATVDPGLCLVNTHQYKSAQRESAPPTNGDDIYVTSQLCMFGKGMIAGNGVGYHLREEPSSWEGKGETLDTNWLRATIAPILKGGNGRPERFKKFMQMIGEDPDE